MLWMCGSLHFWVYSNPRIWICKCNRLQTSISVTEYESENEWNEEVENKSQRMKSNVQLTDVSPISVNVLSSLPCFLHSPFKVNCNETDSVNTEGSDASFFFPLSPTSSCSVPQDGASGPSEFYSFPPRVWGSPSFLSVSSSILFFLSRQNQDEHLILVDKI